MNAGRLLSLYNRVSEAPDAITRLRRFVLELAVRGKLVEQNPADEPASELFPWIAQDGFGDSGYLKNWCRAAVGDVLDFQYGRGLKKSERTEDGRVPVYGSNGIVGYTTEPLTVQPSVIVGRKGSAGALNTCRGPSWITDVAYFVEVPDFFNIDFLFISLSTVGLNTLAKGVKPGLSRADAYSKLVCIPPPGEQHRIVAKVDELMALCDRLEEARTAREGTRDRLTKASLARLSASHTADAAFRSHARFAVDALPALTARADQINYLRQTILNLAVRGKLVEQDPTEEPASELLKQMAAEKARLVKRGGAKKSKTLPPVDPEDAPFDLPTGWAWTRFPEVGVFGRGKSKHRPRNDPILYVNGKYPMVQTGDVARSRGIISTYTNKYNEVGLAQSQLWPTGTLCITIAANIADSGILSFDACFPDSVVGLIPASTLENGRYLEYFMRTVKADLLEFAPATAQKNINLGILETILIPLPPLAEQHRIVGTVGALMTLCDGLEAALTAAATTRSNLLQAILGDALTSADRSYGGLQCRS